MQAFMKNYLIRFSALCLLIFVLAKQSHAQDNHYWTRQYGAKSSLMGGAVVAGVRDNSAVFYNPGAAGFVERSNISVSADAYALFRLHMANGAGTGLDLDASTVEIYPQMISGIINLQSRRFNFNYTLLTRAYNDVKINTRSVLTTEILSEYEGEEDFVGAFENHSQLNEQWGGAGIAMKVSDRVSLGFTQFGSYRSQNYTQSTYTRAIPQNEEVVASSSGYESYSFLSVMLITKLGLAYEGRHFKWGLTFTSPSLHVLGSGEIQREVSSYDVAVTRDGEKLDLLGIDREENPDITYKRPMSIAAGVERSWSKVNLGLSAEYFFAIDPYGVINSGERDFLLSGRLPPSRPNNLPGFLDVSTQADDVLNLALGLEWKVNDSYEILLGARTDLNPYRVGRNRNQLQRFNSGLQLSPSYWHLIHFSGGVNVHKGNRDLTIGITYSRGGSQFSSQIVNLTEPSVQQVFIAGETGDDAEPKINMFSLIIGYTLFKKEPEKANP